jgi:nitrogen PTS system EIIA component
MEENEVMTLNEVAVYLRVAEKTIHRMISRKEIPCVKVAGQWRFLKHVIVEYLVTGTRKKMGDGITKLIEDDNFPIPLSRILKQDLILTGLKAENREEVLTELAKHLANEGIPGKWQDLYSLLLQREEMMTTAVGHGVAFPHPRNPEKNKASRPIILIGISRKGIDFSSLDGEPTKLFCLVYTNNEIVHLKLLSKLSRLLQKHHFVKELLKCKAEQEIINIFIREESMEAGYGAKKEFRYKVY